MKIIPTRLHDRSTGEPAADARMPWSPRSALAAFLPAAAPGSAGAASAAAAAFAAVSAVVALVVAGCSASREGSVQVGTDRQVNSSEAAIFGPRPQWPTEVQAKVGQPVMIRLPGTAGTGYTWQVSSPLCDFLPLAFSQQLESSKDGRVGGPSEWVFTFTPVGAGSCSMSFQYHRPWERGVAPADTRTVTVVVVAP